MRNKKHLKHFSTTKNTTMKKKAQKKTTCFLKTFAGSTDGSDTGPGGKLKIHTFKCNVVVVYLVYYV